MAERGKSGTPEGANRVSPPDRPSSRSADRPSSRGALSGKVAKDRPSKGVKERPSKVAREAKEIAAKAKGAPGERRETLATPSAAARRDLESERHAEEVTDG